MQASAQNGVATRQQTAIAPPVVNEIRLGERGVELKTFGDILQFSEAMFKSGLAPKGVANAQAVVVIVQTGLELGLTPMQALQGMHVINGKVGLDGELALAIIRNHPSCEYIRCGIEGNEFSMKGVCVSKRVGDKTEFRTEFSMADAKTAGLVGKAGPWMQYPKRMLMWRAAGFHTRDYWSEVTKGLAFPDELRDTESQQGSDPVGIVVDEISDVSILRTGALAKAKVTIKKNGTVLGCNGQQLITLAQEFMARGETVRMRIRPDVGEIVSIEPTASIEVEAPVESAPQETPTQEATFEDAPVETTQASVVEAQPEIYYSSLNIGQILTKLKKDYNISKLALESKIGKSVTEFGQEELDQAVEILKSLVSGMENSKSLFT